jgi:hypothetical protein
MIENIVTFDGFNNSPEVRGELIRCRKCAFYGIAKPNYCGIIKLFIPEESYCSFAQESKHSNVGNGKPITARY